jgi:hypothetical protein
LYVLITKIKCAFEKQGIKRVLHILITKDWKNNNPKKYRKLQDLKQIIHRKIEDLIFFSKFELAC